MRLWSLHPSYLDTKGLLAVWREGLLAKKVLAGKTKGYKNHPQLIRFKNLKYKGKLINNFLYEIYKEGIKRGFNFNKYKIKKYDIKIKIPVTTGQVIYEFAHLLDKLKKRDKKRYSKLKKIKNIRINSLFKKIYGAVENWEKIKE